MNPQIYERYRFLRLYSIDIDTALKTVSIVGRYKRSDVRISLVRDIAMAYARPFSVSKGEKILKHRLKVKEYVPSRYRELHNELLRLRNQQLAHTDFEFYRPKISGLRVGRAFFPMAFRSYDYRLLISKLSEIELLIIAVVKNIEAEIDKIEHKYFAKGEPIAPK